MGERQRRDRDRLSAHDGASLVVELVDAGVGKGAATAAASRALKAAFRGGDVPNAPTAARLDDGALEAAGIGKAARAALTAMHLAPSLALRDRAPSDDGAARLLFATSDGALVESVVIPGPRRVTLCVSTQVGCARACTFCETGTLGLARGLSTAEIVDQVRLAAPIARELGDGAELSNLVFMGMGEPLDNLAEVGRAVRLLTDARAFAFAPSRVTVSTVGVVDKLEAFFRDVPAELAVSLNAPDDARRSRIMPVNERFDLATLHAALARFVPPRRRVLLEYVLFDRFNDAPEDADLVADFTRGLRARVNVIPANVGPDPALRAPSAERVDAFVARLSSRGVTTLVRRPRGRAVGGACGQLAGAARLVELDPSRGRPTSRRA
jgi:23S rRNA (adenine2503-C2)-methyltransferase